MTSVCNIFFEAPDQNRTQQIVTTEDSHVIVTSFTAPPSPNVKLGELGSRTDKDEQSRDTSGIPAICKYGGVHINGTCHIKPPAPEIEIYPVLVFHFRLLDYINEKVSYQEGASRRFIEKKNATI